MVTLLGPILAQLVTLSAGARAEGRAVHAAGSTYYEAAARPGAGLELVEKRFRLKVLYAPSFTLTPLESNPELLVFHSASIVASYTWRRTAVSIAEAFGYGDQNFRVLATAGTPVPIAMAPAATGDTGTGNSNSGGTASGTPSPGAGTTAPGATGAGSPAPAPTGQASTQHVLNQNVRYLSSVTSANVGHQLAPSTAIGFSLGYTVVGAVESKSKADYPLVKGPIAAATINDQLDQANNIGANLTVQYSSASNDNFTWLVGTGERWTHDFDARTSSQLGVGVAGGRNSRSDGYVAYSIYPTFVAGLTNVTTLSPGSLALGLFTSAAPAVDPATLVLDPRISVQGSAVWQRERFSAALYGSSAFSLSSKQTTGLSTVGGGAGVGYQFGAAFGMDAGVRVAHQAYQGQTVLPWSYAGYLGMTLALSSPLN